MISQNLTVEYLHPDIWKNIGVIIENMHPLKQILYVYTNRQGTRKCVDQTGSPCRFETDIAELSEDLFFFRHPEIDEVRCYTPEGIQYYNKKIQEPGVYGISIDSYVTLMYQIQKDTPGIHIMTNPKIKYRCVWDKVSKMLPTHNAVLLLWIEHHKELFFNCILQFQNRELVKITTTDRYDMFYNQFEECRKKVCQEFPETEYYELKMELAEWKKRTKDWYYCETDKSSVTADKAGGSHDCCNDCSDNDTDAPILL